MTGSTATGFATESIAIWRVDRGQDFIFASRKRRDSQDQPLLIDSSLDVRRLDVVLQPLYKNLFGGWIHAQPEIDLYLPDPEHLHLLHRRDRLLVN